VPSSEAWLRAVDVPLKYDDLRREVPMVNPEVRDEILQDLEALPPGLQRKAQEYVRGLVQTSGLPRGASPRDLQQVAGILDDESAREMREAIEEGCEGVDQDAW
jgi:hypothetical protein